MPINVSIVQMSDLLSKPEHRSRRAHRKSRNGCMKCKLRRKKCDERRPQCSRCSEKGLSCQYPERPSEVRASEGRKLSPAQKQSDHISGSSRASSRASSSPFDGSTRSSLSPSSNEPRSLPSTLDRSEEISIIIPQGIKDELDPRELELLNHYLAHTAQAIAFDKDDLYSLGVGIPTLAIHSKPLMSSILALAAVCKCHDLLTQTNQGPHSADLIQELLCFAERHHKTSLQQTQAEIANTSSYDCVLANAPLMVLYGTASHSVCIRLSRKMAEESNLWKLFACHQSQWMFLIRAAHLAYTGVHNSELKLGGMEKEDNDLTMTVSHGLERTICDKGGIRPQDGPSKVTRRLFLPILAATEKSALEKLRSKVQRVTSTMPQGVEGRPADGRLQADGGDSDLQTCVSAMEVLDSIVDEVFRNHRGSSLDISSIAGQPAPDSDLGCSPSNQQRANFSGWLRSYLARVTSATPHRPLRRTITSFLNRVPAKYLTIAQSVLDLIPWQVDDKHDELCTKTNLELPQDNAVHRLCMDIFAHWLVLIMLLDGVWWIGDIGDWELGRVVSFMRHQGWIDHVGGNWWPESMYNIARELKKCDIDRKYV